MYNQELKEERVILNYSYSVTESVMVGKAQQGSQEGNWWSHFIHSESRMKWRVGEWLHSLKACPPPQLSTCFSKIQSLKGSITSPNIATDWWPNIPMHNPTWGGELLILNSTKDKTGKKKKILEQECVQNNQIVCRNKKIVIWNKKIKSDLNRMKSWQEGCMEHWF